MRYCPFHCGYDWIGRAGTLSLLGFAVLLCGVVGQFARGWHLDTLFNIAEKCSENLSGRVGSLQLGEFETPKKKARRDGAIGLHLDQC